MELRYCEECGDVIQVETSTPANITDHFVCERCKSGAGAPRPEAAASEDVQAGSLNLFSAETIAIRKKKIDEDTTSKKPKSSRLKLVKANEEAEPRRATDPPRATLPPVASPAPVAEPPQPAAEPVPGSTTGSAAPAKSARRILFRCLHCRSTLSIRPVEKTSKLTCPHCTNVIYVTPTGRLLKNSPSVALRKGEVAPTELLSSGAVGSGTNPAASVVQRNPASVAIKKTGSVVVSKAGVRKTGSNVGLRNTAFKEQQQAAAAQQPSARFQRPAADGAAPPARKNEVPLKDIPMASINPATSWMPKPASAFREHEENQDPGKTAFLTEERTGDLSDLTSSPALAGVAEQFALPDLRNAPPAPSPRLGALLPADGEMDPGNGPLARSRPRAAVRRPSVPAKPAPPRYTHGRDGASHAIRGLFLLLCICAPLLVAGLILTKHADASGGLPDETTELQSGMLDTLGGIAEQGVRHILGPRPDPYAE